MKEIPRRLLVKPHNLSFPQSRKLSGVGNRSENKERFRTSRNDRIAGNVVLLTISLTFQYPTVSAVGLPFSCMSVIVRLDRTIQSSVFSLDSPIKSGNDNILRIIFLDTPPSLRRGGSLIKAGVIGCG